MCIKFAYFTSKTETSTSFTFGFKPSDRSIADHLLGDFTKNPSLFHTPLFQFVRPFRSLTVIIESSHFQESFKMSLSVQRKTCDGVVIDACLFLVQGAQSSRFYAGSSVVALANNQLAARKQDWTKVFGDTRVRGNRGKIGN